jgi:8-amino-7-oxononanoate synthase
VKHSGLPTPPALAHLEDRLEQLRTEGLLRHRAVPLEAGALSFCSNDYLGLASEPLAVPASGPSGAGASRLVCGERVEHRKLELALANWLETEDALLFSSGYAANFGTVAALASADDRIVSDALNHASLIDGCRLSRAEVAVVPHLDLGAVAEALARPCAGRLWVVTESYFGMDADAPDLKALRALCDRFGAALVVDEAHALGVLGPEGRGLCAEAGVQPDVLIGTLGKSFGHSGAFVAGSQALTTWLWNRARPFVFSTGVSPAVAHSATAALGRARAEPWRRARVRANAEALRTLLGEAGFAIPGFGHIVPVLAGTPERAVQWASELTRQGLPLHPIRPPTVPRGTSRLRLTVTALHSEADLSRLVGALRRVVPA